MAGELEATLGAELLAIHEESYGAGAERVTIARVDDTIIAFLDGLSFHPTERFLIDHGQAETVLRSRAGFQESIGSTYEAAVERATGRRVESFASTTKLDPPYCVEIFRLAAS